MATLLTKYDRKCEQALCYPFTLAPIKGIESDKVMSEIADCTFLPITSNINTFIDELVRGDDAAIVVPNTKTDLWLVTSYDQAKGLQAFTSRGKEIWLKGDEFRFGKWVQFNFLGGFTHHQK
jgi:hypothetical protein